MQINEETQAEQQAPSEGGSSAPTPGSTPAPAAPAPAVKKASKKKASKKSARELAEGDMAQVLEAADQLRDALYDLASHQINQRRQLVEELRTAARSGFSEVETAARKTLNRLTGKG